MSKALQNTIRYPTSVIVRGADQLGIELAKSLLEQGGYVIIVDRDGKETQRLLSQLGDYKLFTLLDFSALSELHEDLRRLDYVFYLQHKTSDLDSKVSSQDFLQSSNYLDSILDLTTKFEAKFLLTTSIKAHQLVLARGELDINFGSGSKTGHQVYTDMEIQKYAESLVQEYEEKVGIDARVIRVGQILGNGMELDPGSKIVELMYSAIKGENLKIPGDGLDTDFYIHHLDAAYGILKAQFSMNTKGKIFTLANEEEVTILSIAYKLLELEPKSKEILFDQNDNYLPPLKLYKPAPNLHSIGWSPRVSLERALAQSLDYIREEIANPRSRDDRDNDSEGGGRKTKVTQGGLLAKIRDFFFIIERNNSQEEEEPESPETLGGALNRLITERKSQEKARKGSIVVANNKLRKRLAPEQGRTLFEKASYKFNDIFIAVKKRFYFLRSITQTDLLFITMGLVAFVAVYFILISPALSLAKNIFFIRTNLESLAVSGQQFDLRASADYNKTLKAHLLEAQERLKDLQYLFDLTQNRQMYLDLQNYSADGVQFTTGLEDVFTALEPFTTYIDQFQSGITYRFSDSNMLTAAGGGNYNLLIEEMRDGDSLFRIGIDRVEKASLDLSAKHDSLPEYAQDVIGGNLTLLQKQVLNLKHLQKSYHFLPLLLGNDGKKTYLLVVSDNVRYSAAGGEVAGTISFEMESGVVKNIVIKSTADLDSDFVAVSNSALGEINLLSNKDVNRNNIELGDLSLIGDQQVFLKTYKDYYESRESRQTDVVMDVNLNTLLKFLDSGGSVEFQQLEFNSANLLANINLLLGDKPTQDFRNEIVLNLFAKVIEREFSDFQGDFLETFSILSDSRAAGEFPMYADDIQIKNYINVSDPTGDKSIDSLIFGLNYDQKDVIINKFPLITISATINVNKDMTTSKTVEINSAGVESIQNTYLCTPGGSKDFSFSGVKDNLVTSNFTLDKACVIFQEDDDLKYSTSFTTLPFENSANASYNYSLDLIKSPGIVANYDIELNFDPSLNIVPDDNSYIRQDQSYVYTGVMDGMKSFSFEISQDG